ncbi:hypothetical protein BGW80DRAFT_1344477 [Lactifluus volemus]|nr:hypothetical protein BGW80DRAFT_1344477 [Lactifluus volemus]
MRHPDANRLDMKNFVNRPIPRLARYELLLKGIIEASTEGHEDHESIPQLIEVIKSLLKETEPGVTSANQKVELWRPARWWIWICWPRIGRLSTQANSYVSRIWVSNGVDGAVANCDCGTVHGIGLLLEFGGGNGDAAQVNTPGVNPEPVTDSRAVYPRTILHTGQLGGLYTVYAESTQARSDWKESFRKRLGCARSCRSRTRCSKSRRSARTPFVVPSMLSPPGNQSWNTEIAFTGKVTCSVPFSKQASA